LQSLSNPLASYTGVAVLLLASLAGASAARATDVSVKVTGVKGDLKDNVFAHLAIDDAKNPSRDKVRQLHEQATKEIEEALQPFGYYQPNVESKLEEDGDKFIAHYDIEPGPLLRLEGVDVEVSGPGAADAGFRRLVRRFPLRRGDPTLHSAYEAGKQSLVDYAAQHGFLEAAFVAKEIRVDLAAYTARIRLTMHTGPQYTFGNVSFDNGMIDEDLLRGYIPFEPGDKFDLGKLLKFQDALASTPYFRRVEVIPQEDEAVDRKVPIHVLLVPARRDRYSFGLGYGPDTGARGSVGVDVRRLNTRGHRLETTALVSGIQERFTGTYIVPKSIARTDYTSFSVGYDNMHSDIDTHESGIVSAGLDRARGKWRQHFDLAYQRETFDVGPDQGSATLLMPEGSVQVVRADNVLYPMRGRKLQFQLRAANAGLVGSVGLLQGIAQAKYVQQLFGPVRGIGRVRLGYTETNTFHRLPASLRFFAGGDQSVRGYGYQELTPRDEAGLPTGGNVLVEASFEADALLMQFRSFGRFGAAVFFDTGNAMMTSDVGSLTSELSSGVGAGLRWLSPVGLVRVDVAFGLDLPGQPMRFYFSLGPDL